MIGADLPRTIPEQCQHLSLPEPVAELRFHPKRKWRFDWAWPEYKLAVEQDGAVHTQGRHTRGTGFIKDMEKLNAAASMGWLVLRYTPDQVRMGVAINDIAAILRPRSEGTTT